MSPSTAAHKLRMDLLYRFINNSGYTTCYRCGEALTRDTFSIDHKVPWLDSEKPKEDYFDLENIAFSHKSCNYAAARRPTKGKLTHGKKGYEKGCRCKICKIAKSIDNGKRKR